MVSSLVPLLEMAGLQGGRIIPFRRGASRVVPGQWSSSRDRAGTRKGDLSSAAPFLRRPPLPGGWRLPPPGDVRGRAGSPPGGGRPEVAIPGEPPGEATSGSWRVFPPSIRWSRGRIVSSRGRGGALAGAPPPRGRAAGGALPLAPMHPPDAGRRGRFAALGGGSWWTRGSPGGGAGGSQRGPSHRGGGGGGSRDHGSGRAHRSPGAGGGSSPSVISSSRSDTGPHASGGGGGDPPPSPSGGGLLRPPGGAPPGSAGTSGFPRSLAPPARRARRTCAPGRVRGPCFPTRGMSA